MPRFKNAILFIVLFFAAFTNIKAAEKDSKLSVENYILILSSYQYDNPYATAIAKKIQNELEKENPALVFRSVYASLDIQKTMLASRLNMQKAFSQARLTPSVLIPKVLVLIGDESWMLYRIMNLRGKWENVPVVLCGVHHKILKDYTDFFTGNSFADSLMLPISQSTKNLQITGVIRDEVGYNRTTFMQKMFPGLKEVIYISGGNYYDEYAWHQEKKILSTIFPEVKLSYFNSRNTPADSIYRYTNHLSPDSAIILFNSSPPFITSLHLPVYALQDGEAENNSINGGYYTTSGQFARQTARLVMRIYNGTPVSELPFQYVQNHNFYINAQAPNKTSYQWKAQNFPEVIYYNIPPPFLVRNQRLLAVILLIISISVISYLIWHRTRKYQQHTEKLLAKYKILHEKFQVIYDNMPVTLLIFDEQGDLLSHNPAVNTLQKVWHRDHLENLNLFRDFLIDKRLQEKIRLQENITRILPVQDGKYQPRPSNIYEETCNYFRLVIRYIPDKTRNTDNILVMLIDITDIYQEKLARKRIRNVFNFAMNKASIGVAEYDLYNNTGLFTKSWRQHLGIEDKQNRKDFSMFRNVSQDDQKSIRQFLKQAYKGEKDHLSQEISVTHEDGSVHYLRQQLKIIEYQPEDGQILIAELNENIDKEKQVTTEIQAAIGKAQEAERLKNTFIANMSHEIRTPLNAIVGFSNLMISTKDIEVRQEMIHHIEESNETLLRLVNDIIDLSKIESGSMSYAFSETDVNALFHDITAIHQFKASQKRLNLVCHCPLEELFILTDKIRVRQVISNFLSNALKFTDQGSIELGYRLDGDKLYLYVSDTGIGIPENKCQHIFNRFFRANKVYQGYGLGLSISQAFIQGLNGDIGVESQEGKGSTFWASLPVKIIKYNRTPQHPGPLKEKHTNSITEQKPHILVVEDDSSNFLLIHFMLKNSCRITHAWNGEEAIQLYQQGLYDLILMDIKMPKKNGYEATREIRALSADIPIIATTAYAFSKDETQALNNGFNAYLAKPLERKLLLETINYWLNYAN